MSFKLNHAALLIAAGLSLVAAPLADCAEIYRWIDDQGRVHYGDSVPQAQRDKASHVDTRGAELSEAQRREAEARVLKEKAQAEAIAKERAKAAHAPYARAPAPGGSRTADKKGTCEEQWRRYRESDACFAPYRLANGGIRAEAFQKCVEVQVPALC